MVNEWNQSGFLLDLVLRNCLRTFCSSSIRHHGRNLESRNDLVPATFCLILGINRVFRSVSEVGLFALSFSRINLLRLDADCVECCVTADNFLDLLPAKVFERSLDEITLKLNFLQDALSSSIDLLLNLTGREQVGS